MFRKFYYPFSICRQFYSRSGESTSSLGSFQQVSKEKNDPYMTVDGIPYVIRSLTIPDIPQLVRFVRQLRDKVISESCLHSWLKKDPNGIKVAITGRDEIIGVLSGVKIGDSDDEMCFLGLFMVNPEYRQKGIGRMLCKHCLQHVGNRNAGLNAVPGKLEVYRDIGGFVIHETNFTILEYSSSSWPLHDFTFLTNTPPPGISICPLHSSHLPSIFAYDFELIGIKRTSVLASHVMEAGSQTLVALRNDGSCAGFGTIKMTGGVVKMGPLYADTHDVADVLLRRLLETMVHQPMDGFLFVSTSANRHAMQCMNRLGVAVDAVCDRLYNNKTMDVKIEKVYGLFDSSLSPC